MNITRRWCGKWNQLENDTPSKKPKWFFRRKKNVDRKERYPVKIHYFGFVITYLLLCCICSFSCQKLDPWSRSFSFEKQLWQQKFQIWLEKRANICKSMARQRRGSKKMAKRRNWKCRRQYLDGGVYLTSYNLGGPMSHCWDEELGSVPGCCFVVCLKIELAVVVL